MQAARAVATLRCLAEPRFDHASQYGYPAFLTVAALVQAMLGDGKYALAGVVRARPVLQAARA